MLINTDIGKARPCMSGLHAVQEMIQDGLRTEGVGNAAESQPEASSHTEPITPVWSTACPLVAGFDGMGAPFRRM